MTLLGAGLIGCEFANDLRAAGHPVTVVDPSPLPLGRLLPAGVAQAFLERLTLAGVQWRLGTLAERIDRTAEGALRATLADGQVLEAEVVLSAVGLRPRVALAAEAGLAVSRGIVVDRFLSTADPRVFALGDCAEVDGHLLPYVMPLMQCARALAATLAGRPTAVSYPVMPVAVKTPAAPLVVSPPAPGTQGEWRIAMREDGLEAEFVDAQGVLRGFALLGKPTAQRMGFARRVPALF
ncbi:MAG TPA: FAD-dependent oxidoreductase [Burkholderiaceae bacterium]|nr:FAD-dependent oxidoreductase [Burkholderiaceae bacterium]